MTDARQPRPGSPSWLDDEFLTPAFFADPYRLYERLLEEAPVAWSRKAGAWLVCSFDDVSRGLSDPRLSSGARIPTLARALSPGARVRDAAALDCLARMMAFTDPPTHTRLRKLVSQAFTARRVAALEPEVSDLTDALMSALPRSETFDLVPRLTFPLPAMVICRLLGIPETRLADVHRWADAVVTLLSSAVMTDEHAGRARMAVEEAGSLIRQLAEDRLVHPGDELLTAIVSASVEGDALSKEEVAAMVILLFFAGFETTEGLIGNAALNVMADDDLVAVLADDPDVASRVVEEVLRFDPPVHRQSRIAVEPVEIAGAEIAAGETVLLMIGAAGRDTRCFRDPSVFDPWRPDLAHVGFGHGIHFCLGAALARLEARVALVALARSPRRLRPAAPVTYGRLLAVRKPAALPFTVS